MKSQLLCTFSNKENLYQTLDDIRNWYDILYSSVYVFSNLENSDDLFITYNINSDTYKVQLPNTILLHRKKQTNTMYTINALNQLIMLNNGGVLDKNFTVDWEQLKNSILIWTGSELKRVSTEIHTVYKFIQ